MTQPHKQGCKCKEMSCPEDCKNNHTHKTFYCEKCEPVYPPVQAHEMPECDCNGMHEGSCPDPRAEENCPGEHCVYSSFEICPFDGSIHAPTPRGWEEQFDDEKLKSLLGGYCWGQDGGNGGYDYSDIKSFIASEIEKAVKETEERKDKEYSDFVHRMNTLLNESDKAVLEERRRISDGVAKSKWGEFMNLEQVLAIINPK